MTRRGGAWRRSPTRRSQEPARGAGELALIETARQARHDRRLGQWDRVHLERHVRLDAGQQGRLAFSFAPGKPMQNGFCESFQRAHARRASSTRACSSASIIPGPRSRPGSTITNSDGRTRRWAISHRQPMPPISPQHAIGCATPTSLPPIACCSTCAPRRKTRRGSNCLRMKVQWQVTSTPICSR